MKIDPVNETALAINSTGIGTVTHKMVRERAVELAIIDRKPSTIGCSRVLKSKRVNKNDHANLSCKNS